MRSIQDCRLLGIWEVCRLRFRQFSAVRVGTREHNSISYALSVQSHKLTNTHSSITCSVWYLNILPKVRTVASASSPEGVKDTDCGASLSLRQYMSQKSASYRLSFTRLPQLTRPFLSRNTLSVLICQQTSSLTFSSYICLLLIKLLAYRIPTV